MTKPRVWYIVEYPEAYRTRSWFYEDEKDVMRRWMRRVREKYRVRGKYFEVSVNHQNKQTMKKKSKPTIITVYQAKDGWRWRMKRAGRIVAESGEAYKRHASVFKSLKNLLKSIEMADYDFQLP